MNGISPESKHISDVYLKVGTGVYSGTCHHIFSHIRIKDHT